MQELFQTHGGHSATSRQKHLFYESTVRDENHLPDLNYFVDEYWKLALSQNLQAWKTKKNPLVITHRLINEDGDEILKALNCEEVVESMLMTLLRLFITPILSRTSSPLFGMDYNPVCSRLSFGNFSQLL